MSVVLLLVLGCCRVRCPALGRPRGSAATRRVVRRKQKKPQSLVGTAAPGPRLWSRLPDQVVRDLRPHPPHGGAASAYTCSRRLGCESRSANGRPCRDAASTVKCQCPESRRRD